MTMKQGFWIGLAMGFCFVLGCSAAITIIPNARAQSTPRWEYLEIRHGWDGGQWAAEAGRQGWELVQFDRGDQQMVFKRPLF